MKSCHIFNLPDAVLLTLIAAAHLTQKEQYRLLALCKSWLPLLKTVRTFTFTEIETLNKFVNEPSYRWRLLEMVGCVEDGEVVPRRKLKLDLYKGFVHTSSTIHSSSGNNNKGQPELNHFIRTYIDFLCTLDNYRDCKALESLIPTFREYPHLTEKLFRTFSATIPMLQLFKLHRLRVNQCHEIENVEDLDDDVYRAKHPDASQRDDLHRNTSLAELRGITEISIGLEEDEETVSAMLYLYHGRKLTHIERCYGDEAIVQENLSQLLNGVDRIDLIGSAAADTFLPAVNGCRHVELEDVAGDISVLANTSIVSCRHMRGITDVSALQHAAEVELSYCNQVSDISMLGEVQQLKIGICSSITSYPTPLGRGQHWTFEKLNIASVEDFDRLEKLVLVSCDRITDLRMLSKIKYLSLQTCTGIQHYPIPAGENQEWTFQNMPGLVNLNGYNKLRRLHLDGCNNFTDISMLTNMHSLSILRCKGIWEVHGLSDIHELVLDTGLLKTVSHLSNIDTLTLEHVDAPLRCHSIEAISHLRNINTLKIIRCEALKHLSDLQDIHTARVVHCSGLNDVSSLAHVKMLDLIDCKSVTDVSMLAAAEELNLRGCSNVQSVEGMHNIYGNNVPAHLRSTRSDNLLYGKLQGNI